MRAFVVFEHEAGFSLTPPTSRTWSKCGRAPVIRVRGGSQRRISLAALACYRPGSRSRLIYRLIRHGDHKRTRRRTFTWTDYRDLLSAAHQQLGAPMVWCGTTFIDTRDWITAVHLPPYAPDLNPVEGVWSYWVGVLLPGLIRHRAGQRRAHVKRRPRRGQRDRQLLLGAGQGLRLSPIEAPDPTKA
ncbi:IS630 family transposase [Streptomyces sp. DG2A-72]|uniref:transposase n=1 Tax=Streptomyces sp. DG2A-72 TaxID=3051386 RepID=UPI00265C8CEF|nr:IS630 family transposase [Streptomyces sp. DG2A-72]MDO0938496.1 IS630 family transposase [Streptomyces sp. DG2A-72]